MKCKIITWTQQSTNKEHKDVVKRKESSSLVKDTFLHLNYHIHAKLLLLDSCLFPLLQIQCIHNNQGNNFYIVLNSM
jgi:hypothetical protein